MKSRGLLLGLVVLALLLGALYWSNRQSAAKTPAVKIKVTQKTKLARKINCLRIAGNTSPFYIAYIRKKHISES